jgi:hypothetical protein
MEINWYSIGGVLLFAVVLIVFLVKRNLKDKKKLEEFLDKNEDSINKEESEPNDE